MRSTKAFALVLATLLGASSAYAVTYNTPNLTDGGINISAGDWDADELWINDSNSDSIWGSGNEVDNVYLTWDANNLYVGYQSTFGGNGHVVYIDAGIAGGENDFNSGNGYTGAYPRNLTFSTGIDMILGAWSNGAPGVWKITDNASTDASAGTTIQSGTGYAEVAIPWNNIYGLGAGVVPANASIGLVAAVVGGDNFGGPDSAPDNASTNGDGGPDAITNLRTITVDANGDGTPDASTNVPVSISGFELE